MVKCYKRAIQYGDQTSVLSNSSVSGLMMISHSSSSAVLSCYITGQSLQKSKKKRVKDFLPYAAVLVPAGRT